MWVVVVDTKRLWYLVKGCPRTYANGTVQAEWTNRIKDARIFPDRAEAARTASMLSTQHGINAQVREYAPSHKQ